MNNVNPLVTACTWVYRLAWLHFCWVILTLCGGVLFGLFPATVVVLTMLRRYLNERYPITFAEMWREMKAEFVRANKSAYCVAFPLFSIGYYGIWGIENLQGITAMASLALFPILLIGCALLAAMLFQISIYQYVSVKQDVLNGLILLFRQKSAVNFGIVFTIFVFGLGYLIPIIFLFFGIIPVLFAVMYVLWLNNSELKQVL